MSTISAVAQWCANLVLGANFLLMLGMFAFAGLVETIATTADSESRLFNIRYALINSVAASLIAPLPALGMTIVLRHTTTGLIDFRWAGFGGVAGAIFAMLLSTLIFDFFYYWFHRCQHANAVLWQEHLLHHSDRDVNVTTSGRTHILEQFLFPVFIAIPMALLFSLPPISIAAISMIPGAWGYVVHANIRLGWGPLWWLLSSPQYHRIHHSIEMHHIGRNFAVWFPLWDILFGTAHQPQKGEFPRTGVSGIAVGSIGKAYLLPLIGWSDLLKRPRHPWSSRTSKVPPL